MDDLAAAVNSELQAVTEVLWERAKLHRSEIIQPLPAFEEVEGEWKMEKKIEDGRIYEMAFDGTDAHAEIIERLTHLTFLGDDVEPYPTHVPCHMSGVMTTRRVLLARTY